MRLGKGGLSTLSAPVPGRTQPRRSCLRRREPFTHWSLKVGTTTPKPRPSSPWGACCICSSSSGAASVSGGRAHRGP